jgi:uncharacterized protein YbjT (DUF2867 family)/uncharacterized protein YndB with AHSA1/START domain
MTESERSLRVLLAGATGYVGGRLVPRLLAAGHRVRVLARDPDRLQGRDWLPRVEVVRGDVFDPASLAAALADADVAYYLVHSLAGGTGFHERDMEAARRFGQTARAAGVARILYLGALGDPRADLSEHLRSRQQTGDALREAGVPVTEFRAAIVVGAGSVSFEMIRSLTERLPVMICPRWVYTRVQPIAIRDVLDYLVAALATPGSAGRIVEIGGADVLIYREMMLGYARARGLRRWLIPVPVLTPRLSSYWVHWVTPIPAVIAEPLIEGLRSEVVVRDTAARDLFPAIHPMPYRAAVAEALAQLNAGEVESAWSDALATSQGDRAPVVLAAEAGMVFERRQRVVHGPPAVVYRAFTGLGGEQGWLYADGLWRLRGLMDRLVGGVGLRRGRRHPSRVRVGDALDFWRVEAVVPDRLLRLRAEMKVPGRAWLEFEAEGRGDGTTLLRQTATFAPKGLAGLLYWYVLYPIHRAIFAGMLAALARQVERATESGGRASAVNE